MNKKYDQILYEYSNISTKLDDLIKILDKYNIDKTNIVYLTKQIKTSVKCSINGCNRYSSYHDIINNKNLCWFHAIN